MKRMLSIVFFLLASFGLIAAGGPGQVRTRTQPAGTITPEARKAVNELGKDLQQLVISQRALFEAVGDLDAMYTKLTRKILEVSRIAGEAEKAGGSATARLIKAVEEMRDMSQSFNMQYLMLQNKISQENRQFTMVSNIMKTKHDTAKNAINNIR